MFFETKHSLIDMEFWIATGVRMNFPKHLHRSYECFHQVKGCTEVTVEDKKYILREGNAVLIFPFQTHSYRTVEDGCYETTIFSPEVVPEFRRRTSGLLPVDNLFPRERCDRSGIDNPFLVKAYCYRICGEFEKVGKYLAVKDNISDDVIKSLLVFAEEHYRSECSLHDAASSIGYDYAYVSKLFKRQTGIAFKKYVNMIRITRSKLLLASSGASITEIAEECGFDCQRTFNREFKELAGVTPNEYRKSSGGVKL